MLKDTPGSVEFNHRHVWHGDQLLQNGMCSSNVYLDKLLEPQHKVYPVIISRLIIICYKNTQNPHFRAQPTSLLDGSPVSATANTMAGSGSAIQRCTLQMRRSSLCSCLHSQEVNSIAAGIHHPAYVAGSHENVVCRAYHEPSLHHSVQLILKWI